MSNELKRYRAMRWFVVDHPDDERADQIRRDAPDPQCGVDDDKITPEALDKAVDDLVFYLEANGVDLDVDPHDPEFNALVEYTASHVTERDMIERIARVEYHVLPDSTVTICNITLDNGFSVRGESACVDPARFDKTRGETYAYERAFAELWPLFGFLLAEKRHIRARLAAAA